MNKDWENLLRETLKMEGTHCRCQVCGAITDVIIEKWYGRPWLRWPSWLRQRPWRPI